jgi:hypothetical protein
LDVHAADATAGKGDFWILKIGYAASPKNVSKNGSAHKGGSHQRKNDLVNFLNTL